ncbi:MAG TPA: hypothetical protein VN903_38385 [Polyangia bacterium]|nr:hypothetical protein [Polyangia bacterium]
MVLAAVVLAPFSIARAAEIQHLYTNNMFASASSDDGAGTFTSVLVTRSKGKGAGPDTISVFSFGPSGFASIMGTLPAGAFHNDAKSASLDIDIADIENATNSGFATAGVISIDWAATDISRTSGSTKFEMPPVTANIVGTTTFTVANVSGSILGADMMNQSGYLNRVHTSVIVHIDTNF